MTRAAGEISKRRWEDKENNMLILDKKTALADLKTEEALKRFPDMIKCVADISKEILAVDAILHSDLESLLLDSGSDNKDLYGFNIYWEDGGIEFDSLINPPRNREAGFPRVGRYVADPEARKKIEEVVDKWIER